MKHYYRMRRAGKIKVLTVKKYDKCAVESCSSLVGSEGGLGFCNKHYQRFKKHGSPHTVILEKLKGSNVKEKIEQNYTVDGKGCWIWQGGKTNAGYGSINIGDKNTALVHRLAYELWVGKIPEGLFVCHHCDVRDCINPKHLFVGTNQDNIDDKVKKGRSGKGTRAPRLNESQVIEIKQMLIQAAWTHSEIAEMYDVDRNTITRIKTGKHWGSVQIPDKTQTRRKRKTQ